ncbi:MAG TPA: sulfotransferase [Gemmataceae bacterium]|nr:sulfotransferase [Gemmataceae bacterium]
MEPAIERLKALLITRLTPPLAGMPLGQSLRLLWDNDFDIDPANYPKLALHFVCSSLTSLMKWREERLYPNAANAEIPPPLFVLGHYRSGTTLLHNLLAVDRRFAFPTMFRNYNPHTFRVFEPIAAPLVARLLPRRRIIDGMAWGADWPQEDELALLMICGMSPYLGFIFSRQAERYERYLSFRDATQEEVERWQTAVRWFMQRLTAIDGRPLILKSPPHTARIRLLLELFPKARFVHVYREPYTVFRSSQKLFEGVTRMVGLQRPAVERIPGRVLRQYRLMYDAYFADRPLIPPGQLHELRFEDLERKPLLEIERTYASLNLPDFGEVRPALTKYVESLQGYRKSEYPPLVEAQRRQIVEEWRRNFEEWGYAA